MFAGWRVTSDFSLKVLEDDTRIAITCNAISQGHHGDTMMKKAEVMLTVLSKWIYTIHSTHSVWKSPKMSHFNFSILPFFGIFNELLSTQNVNVACFARNVEWDFFCDFQTPCFLKTAKGDFADFLGKCVTVNVIVLRKHPKENFPYCCLPQ